MAKLFSYTWNLGEVVCKSVHYMQNVAAICSVFTLTAISIERYNIQFNVKMELFEVAWEKHVD